jgi:imidazolonepropionase-like amidohydrolase
VKIGALILLFVCLSWATSTAQAGAKTLLLENATVVDPLSRTEEKRTITIVDGKVASGSQPPPDAEKIDLTGKWIIPGLIDLHVHCGGNPLPDGEFEELGPVKTSRKMLYAGVVAWLDCASMHPDALFAARNEQRRAPDKHSDQSDIYCAGRAFGRWSAKSPDELSRQIQSYIDECQPDIIKFIYGRDTLAKDCLLAGLRTANKAAVKSVVHIGSWEHAQDAIEGGATVVTHMFDDEVIPDEVMKAWVKHKTISVPTMAVQCDLYRLSANPKLLAVPLVQEMEPAKLLKTYEDRGKFDARAQKTLAWQKDDIANDMKSFHKMARAGIEILAGSDTNNEGTFQGFSLHREMQLMNEGGYTTWQALAGATTGAAKFLGRPGGIMLGDTAEMVILTADPIARISNTEKIWGVVHHGAMVDRAALLQADEH